jgi:hypothetical protein
MLSFSAAPAAEQPLPVFLAANAKIVGISVIL